MNRTIYSYGRPLVLMACSIVMLVGCNTVANRDSCAPSTHARYSNYSLRWSDNFNGSQLSSAWRHDVDSREGIDTDGWGNNEIQWYTNGENVSLEDGKLVIEARRQTVRNKQYTSARIHTHGTQSFQYGIIEVCLRQPTSVADNRTSDRGIWPAFWLLGDNFNGWGHTAYGGDTRWPQSGEIDVMELPGRNNPTQPIGALHWNQRGHRFSTGTYPNPLSGIYNGYHVYGIRWERDGIEWYIDDQVYHRVDISDAQYDEFRRPFFLLLNLALGGTLGGTPNPLNYPQKMYVDWVKHWQCQDNSCQVMGSASCPTGNSYYIYSNCSASDLPSTFQFTPGYENSATATNRTDGGAANSLNYYHLQGTGSRSWAAGGWARTNADATVDLSAYGSLHFSARSSASGPNRISAKMESHGQAPGVGKEISRSFTADGQWHALCIPLSNFTSGANAVTLTAIRAPFVYVLSTPTDRIDIDEIYFSAATSCS